jgi:hypothetical protein
LFAGTRIDWLAPEPRLLTAELGDGRCVFPLVVVGVLRSSPKSANGCGSGSERGAVGAAVGSEDIAGCVAIGDIPGGTLTDWCDGRGRVMAAVEMALVVGPTRASPRAAADTCGISRSAGGGIGVATHGASAAITSAGVWNRFSTFLAIILSTMAMTSSGTSARNVLIDFGWRFWCQISFWATEPSGNTALPVSRK